MYPCGQVVVSIYNCEPALALSFSAKATVLPIVKIRVIAKIIDRSFFIIISPYFSTTHNINGFLPLIFSNDEA